MKTTQNLVKLSTAVTRVYREETISCELQTPPYETSLRVREDARALESPAGQAGIPSPPHGGAAETRGRLPAQGGRREAPWCRCPERANALRGGTLRPAPHALAAQPLLERAATVPPPASHRGRAAPAAALQEPGPQPRRASPLLSSAPAPAA